MIYFTDGSKEAFLTAFLLAYHDEEPCITSSQKQLVLGQESIFVKADPPRAARAEKRLLEFDRHCMKDLSLLLRSSSLRREQIAFGYLKLLSEKREPVRKMLTEPEVIEAIEFMNRITFEVKRTQGFLRFLETESGIPYAPLSPDNDIVDLLATHFQTCLPAFVLHDVARRKAAVFDGTNLFLAPLERAEAVLSAKAENWQDLWRKYFEGVSIPSRERLRKLKGYPPVRYQKFTPEFNDSPRGDS